MLGHQFFLRDADDRVRGPYRLATLQNLARDGRIEATWLVSVDRRRWWRASQMPEVFPEEGLRAAPEWERLKRQQRAKQIGATIVGLLVAGALGYWWLDRRMERLQVRREYYEEMDHRREELSKMLQGMQESQRESNEYWKRKDAAARSTPTALLRARYPRLTQLFSAFLTSRWQAEFASIDKAIDAYAASIGVEGRQEARQEIARLLAEFPEDDQALYDALVLRLSTDYDPCADSTCRVWLAGLAKRLE